MSTQASPTKCQRRGEDSAAICVSCANDLAEPHSMTDRVTECETCSLLESIIDFLKGQHIEALRKADEAYRKLAVARTRTQTLNTMHDVALSERNKAWKQLTVMQKQCDEYSREVNRLSQEQLRGWVDSAFDAALKQISKYLGIERADGESIIDAIQRQLAEAQAWEEYGAVCVDCGSDLELVRPGKWQCNKCDLDRLLEEVRVEERERCAQIAEEYLSPATFHYAEYAPYTLGREIATAIRASTKGEKSDDDTQNEQ